MSLLIPFPALLLPLPILSALSSLLFQPPPLLLFLHYILPNNKLCVLKLNSYSIPPLSNMPNIRLVTFFSTVIFLLATSAPHSSFFA